MTKLSFEMALVYLKQGKKIRRASWGSIEGSLVLENGRIYNVWVDLDDKEKKGILILYEDDIMAYDWEVVE